jgi:hypothetical protein
MKHSIFICFTLALLFLACEREQEVELQIPYKKKLVAVVFIDATSDRQFATLTYTQPASTPSNEYPEPLYVKNATGYFETKDGIIPFEFDSFSNSYAADLGRIREFGETFGVVFSDGNETIKGRTILPDSVSAEVNIQFDSSFISGNWVYHFTVESKLLSNKPAYYSNVQASVVNDDGGINILSDFLVNKVEIAQPGGVARQKYSINKLEGITPVSVMYQIISCNVDLIAHHNSTGVPGFETFLPNSQPIMHYSNMSNDIGIIAAYTKGTMQQISLR